MTLFSLDFPDGAVLVYYLVKKRWILSSVTADFHFRGRVKQKSCCPNEILHPTEENRKQRGHVKLISSQVSHAAEILSCFPRYCFAFRFFFLLAAFSSVPSASVSSPPLPQTPHPPTHLFLFGRRLTNLGFSSSSLSECLVSLLPVFVCLTLFTSRLLSEFTLLSRFYVCFYL